MNWGKSLVQTPTLEALALMRRRKVGCLPFVENERLVGIVTAHDFLQLSAEIVEVQLRDVDAPAKTETRALFFEGPDSESSSTFKPPKPFPTPRPVVRNAALSPDLWHSAGRKRE